MRTLCLALALGVTTAVVATAVTASPAEAAPSRRSIHVVSLNDFSIGGRRFLGRTPIQVTSAFGKPSARATAPGVLVLRYGHWTINFKRRKSDRKLIAWTARSIDPALYGVRGRRLLAPSFTRATIERAVAGEVDWVENGDFNEWFPRRDSFVSGDFPRRISWGIDARGHRWLKLETDLEVEFRS
jgi:hypothetical protein